MPSVPIVQAAFIFCIENPDFDTQRWEELVDAIRNGFDFKDVTNNLVWGFNVDGSEYEFRFCNEFIELCPEFEKPDGFYSLEWMASVQEITDAVENGSLEKFVESERLETEMG